MNLWCNYLSYVFLNYCNFEVTQEQEESHLQQQNANSTFKLLYEWTHLNYTWESPEHYLWAIKSGYYIPKNNALVGMKFYQNKMFLSVPRYRNGVPATLVSLDMQSLSKSVNSLLSPYPNWSANNDTNCSNLQSVQSMEIDTKGILWVIDGVRINNFTRCPIKLILFDLNNGGNIIHMYTFPQEIALQDGGFFNDIVIDEDDGEFAYITDNSNIDPGIVIYSRRKNYSWKLRDPSMFSESTGSNFPVENIIFDVPVPVDGIALSPRRISGDKTLFFCALTAFTLYNISTEIIKNEEFVKSGKWRESIRSVGQKISQTDGMVIDEHSNLYLTMLPLYGVAKWNINQPLWTSRLIDQNYRTMIWPDGLAFDQNGYLYVISNKVYNYIDLRREHTVNGESQFKVSRVFTGTRSYLYA